jgi:adenylate cyclase
VREGVKVLLELEDDLVAGADAMQPQVIVNDIRMPPNFSREGAAGYAYLLKDRVGEGDQPARAVREVASGGSVLDPKIVESLTNPVREEASLSAAEEELLQQVAQGRSVKAIAVQRTTTHADVNAAIEALFGTLAQGLAEVPSESGALGHLCRAGSALAVELFALLPLEDLAVVPSSRCRARQAGRVEWLWRRLDASAFDGCCQ